MAMMGAWMIRLGGGILEPGKNLAQGNLPGIYNEDFTLDS